LTTDDSSCKVVGVTTLKEKPMTDPTKKQIVFSFDTTGSMYPCLTQTRRSITQTVERLFREVPNLEVGIIAHGDYCDAGSSYVTKHLQLTTDKKQIIDFVNKVGATGGGDTPECYELVLHESRTQMKWMAGATKAVVMIGDDVPHPASDRQNTKGIDWRNELELLLEAQIRVYGVQALRRHHATHFYAEIAKKTGGFHLNLDQFSHVESMIFAVVFKQEGDEKLQSYEKELVASGGMNRSVDEMFNRLYGKESKDFYYEESGFRPGDSRVIYGSTSRRSSGRFSAPSGKLRPVHPSRFQVLAVDASTDIAGFVRDNGLIFQTGRGFYELTKTVEVQSYKEVILQEKVTGDFYTGAEARELLGLPNDRTATLKPKELEKYRAFIQSTSANRKLLGGTKFLYEVDASLR
jgi:hypothetical protein